MRPEQIRTCTYTLAINQQATELVIDGSLLAQIVFDGLARRGELRREGVHCHLRDGETTEPEYGAVDLDANNRQPAGTFGWGVCRHGHGLQDLPKLSERQAVELAGKLNGDGAAEVADPDDTDTATLTLKVEMGEHVQSAAEVAGVVGWFVEDRREQLEEGGFVSGPIRNEDGDRVGRYRIAFPLS
jgi:hypothetical protein